MKKLSQNFRLSEIALALTIVLLAGALGCAKSDDGGGNPGGGQGAQTCAPNTPCYVLPTSNIGFYAESQSMKYGFQQYYPSSYTQSPSLFVPGPNYSKFLKEAMGVCDREQYTGGLASCTQWISGFHDLVFMMDNVNSNQVRVVVRAYPQDQGGYYYTYQLPRWDQFLLGMVGFPIAQNPAGFFDPLILGGTIYPINQSQGFEIRAYGPQISSGYNKLMQLQIPVGKVQDNQFNFVMSWNGEQVATGTLVRCQSVNCGL